MRKRAVFVAALVVVALAACSSEPPVSEAGGRNRPAQGDDGGKTASGSPTPGAGPSATETPGGKGDKGNDDPGAGSGPIAAPGPGGPGQVQAPTTEDFAPAEPSQPNRSFARGTSFVEEAKPDAQKSGVTPDYGEVVAASVEGLGKTLRLTARFGGQVPQQMPDDRTYMVIGWSIAPGGNEAYGFSAQGSKDGWRAYAGGREEGGSRFPGTLKVEGTDVVMEVPWSFVGGPRRFNYVLSGSWFRSLAGTTHYTFDSVPNEGGATYPGD